MRLPELPTDVAGQVMFSRSNLQSAVANGSALRLWASVLRMTSSEKELPSSWARRFMPGVRAR